MGNQYPQITIDDTRQQNISDKQLAYKISNAYFVDNVTFVVRMKRNGGEPKQYMVKAISKKSFHVES